MAKKDDPEALEKLVKLTKLAKEKKLSFIKRGEPRSSKYRQQDPKFGPKPAKAENVVEGGGMDVDPSLKEAYDNWRADKKDEQRDAGPLIRRAEPPTENA